MNRPSMTSTVTVPGVRVTAFANDVLRTSPRNGVSTVTIPGSIGISGWRTRYATSRLAWRMAASSLGM